MNEATRYAEGYGLDAPRMGIDGNSLPDGGRCSVEPLERMSFEPARIRAPSLLCLPAFCMPSPLVQPRICVVLLLWLMICFLYFLTGPGNRRIAMVQSTLAKPSRAPLLKAGKTADVQPSFMVCPGQRRPSTWAESLPTSLYSAGGAISITGNLAQCFCMP